MAANNSTIHGLELTRILLEHGANPNWRDFNKWGLSIGPYDELRLDITKSLIKKGANSNARDREGRTPVHCHCRQTEHGGNIQQLDNIGMTPHLLAVGNEQYCHPQVNKTYFSATVISLSQIESVKSRTI